MAPKSHCRSIVWNHFEKKSNQSAVCKECGKELKNCGNTTNLRNHLLKAHMDVIGVESLIKLGKPTAAIKSKATHKDSAKRDACKMEIIKMPHVTDKKIIPLPGGRSEVWKRKLFGFYSNDGKTIIDRQRAVCCLCFSEIPYSGNTTNLGIHLAKKHQDIFQHMKAELEELGGKGIPSSPKSTPTTTRGGSLNNSVVTTLPLLARGGTRVGNITEAVASFLIKDLHSLSFAENEGFRQLLHVLEPRYESLSTNNLAEVLQNRKEAISAILLDKLSEVETCSLVIDCWLSENGRNYCTLMVRFIDNDWQVQTYVLKSFEVTPDSSMDNYMWAILIKVLTDWNLMPTYEYPQPIDTQASSGDCEGGYNENPTIMVEVSQTKVVAVVTNESANVLLAFKQLNMTSIPCFANVVNNAVTVGINTEATIKIIDKVRALVAHLARSSKDRMTVASGGKLNSDDSPTEDFSSQVADLYLDAHGRWTSTADMISKVLELKTGIVAMLMDSKDAGVKELALTAEEWYQLEVLKGALKGFSMAIGVLGGEDAVPCSMVTPLLHRQREKFLKITKNDSSAVYQYNKSVWETLDPQYSDVTVQSFLNISTFLDPRFKDLVDLNESAKQDVIQATRQLLAKMEEDQQCLLITARDEMVESVSPSKRARQRLQELDLLFGTAEEKDLQTSIISGNDLDRYLQEASISINESPLEWWDKSTHRFPALSKIARRYLCVPATAIPSHCVLEPETSIFYNRRKWLTNDEVDLMIFLNKNLSLIG